MTHTQTYKQILARIEKAQNILLITHKKPDGDALGATCALYYWLEGLGKNVKSFGAFNYPRLFDYLPKIENLQNDIEKFKIPNKTDLIFFLDFSDLKQSAIEDKLTNINIPIINIDHHITNKGKYDINLVVHKSSSTCEIIYDFFNASKIIIDKNIATCLLTGILTDTTNFSNPATTVSSLNASSDLLLKGARMTKINTSTWKNKSLNTLNLWGRIFSRLSINKKLNIATTVITLKDLEEFEVDEEAIDGIANFLNNLADVNMILVIKEEKNAIKGSLRTIKEDVDVSQIAGLFGGGGHKKAAGFSLKNATLKETSNGWAIL